jgi:aryl-phospho-beta-D-glucosidase BglC (GH1 family)
MKKISFLFIIFTLFSSVFRIHSQTLITLKVIDQTKGKYTNEIDQKVFSWVAMWSPSYLELNNTGSWYSNFFDGYNGGKLEKNENEWIWSYTTEVKNGGIFSWNPSIGIPGIEDPLTVRYGLRQADSPNINFSVSNSGTITGEIGALFTDNYVALLDVDGNITRQESLRCTIPVKIIDKTMGAAITGPLIAQILNQTNPSQIISNNNDGWCHFSSENIRKNIYEWVYSYTFEAKANDLYIWRPAIGSISTPAYLSNRYKINETPVFSINDRRIVSGENILVIFSATEAQWIQNEEEFDYLGKITVSDNDFLHAQARWIVDENGNPVQLRGIGLGNYLLLEPYMLGINNIQTNKSDTQSAIIASLAKLTGETNVNDFLTEYRKNYIGEEDVKMLKDEGFNSIRLPMHYNLFIEEEATNNHLKEEGFIFVDRLLKWCKKYEIYLILDMHAVPGGQSTDKFISDQYSPGLWDGNDKGTAAQYQIKLIALWKEIARRYATEKWIGGYDLINEIQYYPSDRNLSVEIRNLYMQITAAIREVDKKHLIFIEGNGYGNDHSNLTPAWDDNIALSFHRYWCGNGQATIQEFLNARDKNKIPLWMGESGENSNTWFTNAIELLENNHVGWAWWSYKKVNNISGIVSIPAPDRWSKILNYLESPTDNSASLNLDAETTKNILMNLAENTQLANSKINKDVLYAMIEQPYNNLTRPYGENTVPGKLFANEYDLGRNGYAYNESGLLSRESNNAGAYNNGWAGRNDATDIEASSVEGSNGFNIGWTEKGEWQSFTVNAKYKGKYEIYISYSAPTEGAVSIYINGQNQLNHIFLPNTGQWTNYQYFKLGEIFLNESDNTIQVIVDKPFNYTFLILSYIENVSIEKMYPDTVIFKEIYPNPAGNKVFFVYSLPAQLKKLQFQIYNMEGKRIDIKIATKNNQGTHSLEYNTAGLPSGVYQVLLLGETINCKYKETKTMIVN